MINRIKNAFKSEELIFKLKTFASKKPPKKRLQAVAIGAVIVLIGGVYYVTQFGPVAEEPNPVPEIESTYVAPPEPIYSPLTGLEVSEANAARPVTAVMIENSIDARPQSGLEEAGVVFEAIAEGGITRFMALYQEAKPSNIGPIRSARPYYVEMAKGFDARYLHSGGSGEALALINTLKVKDLDHGKLGSSIADRVSYRFAPHNVYSNFDKIDSVGKDKGFTSSDFDAFARKYDEEPVYDAEVGGKAEKINFDISGANYNTKYTYRPKSNDYSRAMAGIAHKDQDSGKQITPEVIVALEMSYSINSNGIHSIYGTTGTGDAYIFQDGGVTKAKWKRSNRSSMLQLQTTAGESFELNPGQTWITFIQDLSRVTYSK